MIESKITEILKDLGEDPNREGLLKTPFRVAKSLKFLTRGYQQDPKEVINNALFEHEQEDMVIVRDIGFFSMCEHHLLPFFGNCSLGYIPNGKIIGLSKIARLVDIYARRLQVQERMTHEIAGVLEETLNPRGVAVVIQAQHLCMQMRGVEKQNAMMISSCMLGEFKENYSTRSEFMSLIQTHKNG
ncbi:MAG: GTP cyclohydrolase I FolE [Bdellovibrionales bacterium]|nr:GTP cyclohydrolase I FolE [Bdellovibrionales bacterium]